jgi:hypothetical protein
MTATRGSLKALHTHKRKKSTFSIAKWKALQTWTRALQLKCWNRRWLWTRKALHFGAGNWEYVRSKSIAWRRHRNARASMWEYRCCCSWIQCARALCGVGIRRVGGGVVAGRTVWNYGLGRRHNFSCCVSSYWYKWQIRARNFVSRDKW